MERKQYRILSINPGSTSTKVALYLNDQPISQKTIRHSHEELAACGQVMMQKDMRIQMVLNFMQSHSEEDRNLSAVVGRGGLLKPIDSGTYEINEKMLADLSHGSAGAHASSLGGIIASEIGRVFHVPAYIVDPVVVDEMEPVAKISGIPGIERRSVFHALNAKAVARKCAKQLGIRYEDGRFVVAHMGGGISVGAHRYGRVIDVNDALNGDGPFSPERSGSAPLRPIIEMCFSGNYTKDEIMALIAGRGGTHAYLGTNNFIEIENMVKNKDARAALIMEAMAYQVSKEIGAMAAVLESRVNTIILTGGLAYSTRFTGAIMQRVDQIAPVIVFPGEDEMLALAQGALRILAGKEKPKVYQ